MNVRSAVLLALSLAGITLSLAPSGPAAMLTDRVRQLTRETTWRLVASVPVAFTTHHPQGMVKVGDTLFVSSVEIRVRTRRYPELVDGYDRDRGEGAGHLFKLDLGGNLLEHITLGEGAIYHPGGIDFDGTSIWVPVAEYRPNSRSIVYRVDPLTMKATEVFRVADHVGALVHDTDDGTLHGVSWGSRRFYRWRLAADGRVATAGGPAEALRGLNPSHYLDYQDCRYAGGHRMLCTGVAEMQPPGAPGFRLGGIDLVDLGDGRPVHQVPLVLRTPGGLPMTQNAVWIEPWTTGLRGYFMPEDDTSTLYIYEVNGT